MKPIKIVKQSDKEVALINLKSWIKEDDKIFYIIKNVSSSGMYRHIDFYKFTTDDKGRFIKIWLSYQIAKALDYPFKRKTNSVGVSGCGMDMGFSVISNLGYALFDDYKKLKYEQL
ncbi:hypothetical protein [uncultured Mediterranean phage uvMED]|nr:hypothetical protein [uncultured Mediterranean phage uvMED]|tara:strand:+ start:347 stop:694 length:348 start_codon:yes stop_codon:yes gene_type:complete